MGLLFASNYTRRLVRVILAAAVLAPASVPAALLHDNGPLVTHPGQGVGGADASAVQYLSLGMWYYGFNCNGPSWANRVADDFTIPSGKSWQIDSIVVYGYEASLEAESFSHVDLQIWDGPPGEAGSSVVFGDTTTNRLTSSVFSGIYRVDDEDLLLDAMPIDVNAVAVDTILPPGVYWVDWSGEHEAWAFGPYAPPITINGSSTTGNGLHFFDGVWNVALDGGTDTPQGFPFLIHGTVVDGPTEPVPAMTPHGLALCAMLMLGVACVPVLKQALFV